MTTNIAHPSRTRSERGQSIVEFAIALPLLLVVTLGVVETSNALYHQHIITKIAREGANLISRETTLQDAETALRNMATSPINYSNGTTVIFSVMMRGQTGTNAGHLILMRRRQFGSLPASSRLNGSGSFGGPPEYAATNPNNTASLRVTNAPANIVATPGAFIYVTEIYSRYTTITPLNMLGISLPNQLYSVAYF
jgi:Flp pilus assembly protein TadG